MEQAKPATLSRIAHSLSCCTILTNQFALLMIIMLVVILFQCHYSKNYMDHNFLQFRPLCCYCCLISDNWCHSFCHGLGLFWKTIVTLHISLESGLLNSACTQWRRSWGSKDPPLSWVRVTYKAVTPQFWRHVDVTFFTLYIGYGQRRLSLIKFWFDLGPP